MKDELLTEKIIGCAYRVHNILGFGFLEKVYENAMRIELEKQGLEVRQQSPIKGINIGLLINFGPSVQVKRRWREALKS